MNLKDRMRSGTQPSKPQETAQTMNSDSTTQKLNLQPQDSILQKQSAIIQKQTEEIRQLTSTIQEMQLQRDSVALELKQLKNQGRSTDIEAIQTLSLEKLKLKSAIADLRAELSSVQRINQSLTKNNQLLTQSNDDLRNNAGLMSIKEQEQLEERYLALMSGNAEMKRKVNMSNVKAVQSALAAQKAAEQKAKQEILACEAEAKGKVYAAIMEKNAALKEARKRVRTAEQSKRTAWGYFLFTLLCCLIANPIFASDIGYFVCAPIIWCGNTLNTYTEWIKSPYYSKFFGTIEKTYPFSTGWAWLLRILSFLILPVCGLCIFYGIYCTCRYYLERWCRLSLEVLMSSIISIVVFGEEIRKYVGINLVLLLVIIQVIYLIILRHLDKCYDSRNCSDDWERIQNKWI